MLATTAISKYTGALPAQSSEVNALLRQAVGKHPSGLIITHAMEFFNLSDNPRWPIIPDSVKWQLLQVASAYKDSYAKIHLSSENFAIDHLYIGDLTLLYRIIRSYHFNRELLVFGEHAMFHKHIEFIEARFEKICSGSYEDAKDVVEALRAHDDESLAPTAKRMEELIRQLYKPSMQIESIESKIARAVKKVHQEMMENRFKPTYPSGLLLLFADQYYNLTNKTELQPRIPDEVKYQILHAAKAYKDDKKIVHLGNDFGFEHLSHEHVVTLLMILTAFYDYEKKAKGPSNAIFFKHIFLIESSLEHLCWTQPLAGRSVIKILNSTHNTVLGPITQKLEMILANRDRYLEVPNDFELYPKLFGLFTAPTPAMLKIVLAVYGPKAVMTKVKHNYDVFLRWMKTIGDMEELEQDPLLQKAIRRWKSDIQERFYNKHFTLLCKITEAYPEYFKSTLADKGSLAILNNGAQIMLEKFHSKGSITGTPVICSSYEEYRDKLRDVVSRPSQDGQWFFSIRCEQREPYVYNVHQTGAYIERVGEDVFVHILDATPYDFDNGPYRVAEISKEIFPTAKVYATMVARQRDFNNCAFFMFNDMKEISRNKACIVSLREKSINILEYVERKFGADVARDWRQKAPAANLDVNVTNEIPLGFVTPTQSLSEVDKALNAIQDPSSLDTAQKVRKKVARHKLIELSTESAVTGNDVSGYAKLKAMKYRLDIVQQVFPA